MNEQNNPNHLLTETEHQRYEDMLTNEEKRDNNNPVRKKYKVNSYDI